MTEVFCAGDDWKTLFKSFGVHDESVLESMRWKWSELVIGRRTAPGAAAVEGTITVRNWRNDEVFAAQACRVKRALPAVANSRKGWAARAGLRHA